MKSLSWKTIGIISTILLIIISSFQIYDWFSENRDKVIATFEISKFHMPNNLKSKYSYRQFDKFRDEVFLSLKDSLTSKSVRELSDTISSIAIEYFDEPFYNSLMYPLDIIDLKIESNSGKVLSNLSLDIDAEGYYQIYTQDEKVKYSTFDHIIELEDLRPNNAIQVVVWTSDLIFREKDIKINYDNGHVIPDKISKASGIIITIYKYRDILLIPLIGLLAWFLLIKLESPILRFLANKSENNVQLNERPLENFKRKKKKKKKKKISKDPN